MNAIIKQLLESLGVPVGWHKVKGDHETYITYFFFNEQGVQYANDEETASSFFLQVDVVSKKNYSDLVKQVKEQMKTLGCNRSSEVEFYTDGVYQKTLRFRINKQI